MKATVLLTASCLFLLLLQQTGSSLSEKEPVPLFEGLGKHSRRVSQNHLAQKYFDQGLAFLFAFNHDEAIAAFEECAHQDPECAMAYWGIAQACGIHINKPVLAQARSQKAWNAIQKATQKMHISCSPVNKQLILALSVRFSEQLPTDRTPLEQAYRQAMKKAWQDHPNDADIGAIYAESMMNLRPWDLWTNAGQPQVDTLELVETLETVLNRHPEHPLALHLYLHAMEASPQPAKALNAANRLRHLQPGLGHMVHMPSHIDVRCGRWQDAVEANHRAISADAAYYKKRPNQAFYRLYMAHNQHMLAFACMMNGQSKTAIQAVQTMLTQIPVEWLSIKENALIADGYMASLQEVMIRFGKWDEVLAVPPPPPGFPIAKTLWHHARGIALAAKRKPDEARTELRLFQEFAKKTPADASFGNNTAVALFAVAELVLEGEIFAAEGNLQQAIEKLQMGVKLEDQLRYNEPPDWIIPVRHPLGAFLIQANRSAEAEAVYREDLKKWPNNGWSLFGLASSLKMQGKKEIAAQVQKEFQAAWKYADIAIHASCLCRRE